MPGDIATVLPEPKIMLRIGLLDKPYFILVLVLVLNPVFEVASKC